MYYKINNVFLIELVEDVCPLPGAGQIHTFPLLPPAPHAKVARSPPVVRLATKKLVIYVDAVVGLKLLAATLVDKHIANLLPKYVLVRRLQRLESLITYITGVTAPSLVCFVPPH